MTLAGRRLALLLATSTGGVGRHVHALARGLVAGGADLRVLGPAATEELFGFRTTGAGFAPVEIASGARPWSDAAAVAALRRHTGDRELVHAHGLRAGFVATLARRTRLTRRRTPVPLVTTWHNAVLADGIAARVLEPLERVVARGADVTLGASDDLVARAYRLGARDARPAPVAAPPLPPSRREPAEVRAELGAAGRPLVLAVGRLHPQKGFDVLVDAAAAWARRRPAPLVAIAGSGPLAAELAARVAASRAPVRLLGRRDDVADLLAAADVVVLPSRWEARALVAQEALRAGRPLVATPVGGMPGLVGGGAALLVPPGDAAALAAAVEGLLDDPAAAADLAAAGRERAASWPTEEDTVAQVVAVYAELFGGPA